MGHVFDYDSGKVYNLKGDTSGRGYFVVSDTSGTTIDINPDGSIPTTLLTGTATAGKVYITDGSEDADVVQAADDTTDLEDTNGLVSNSILNTRISNTAIRPLRADASTHSIQTIDYEHHEIHSGSHFFVSGYQDLANGNVLDFTWQMPNTTSWIHWIWEIETEVEYNWYVYETATATNPLANVITAYNNNRNVLTTSGTTMRFEVQADLATANADTSVAAATLLESGIVGAGKSAGMASRSRELVMKQNTLYCLRAIANAAGYINFNMQWYEHTDKN